MSNIAHASNILTSISLAQKGTTMERSFWNRLVNIKVYLEYMELVDEWNKRAVYYLRVYAICKEHAIKADDK